MNPKRQRKKEEASVTVGAILCGILAGLMTTAIFLWVFTFFDTYRVAFSGRLGELTPHFKYLFLILSASAWSLVFSKWIFKREQLRS